MKKNLLSGLFIPIMVVVVMAVTAHAARVVDVSATVHNFSTSGGPTYVSSNEQSVCIFCHTPHNARVANERPLWNRELPVPVTGWQFYNSVTLTDAARPNTIVGNGSVQPASLMCLSCHDGSVAWNRVVNKSNVTGDIEVNLDPSDAFVMITGFYPFAWSPGKRIGASTDSLTPESDVGKLNDDHPISFSYVDAISQEAAGALNPINDAKTAGLVFYPLGGSADHIECGTCHDPHVAYDPFLANANPAADPAYEPFLRIPNTGSAMCLTCHNK